jgi:hypothetical protein
MDEPEILPRLTENIRDELQAQNALGNLGLSEETLDSMAQAIAANIDYAFEARWAPQWEGHRRPNSK